MGQNAFKEVNAWTGAIEVVDWTTLKPGDHIYSDRRGHLYYHHGIYIGNFWVIHFMAPAKGIELSATPCNKCGYKQGSGGGIIKTCLDCFIDGHRLFIYEYGVDLLKYHVKPRGSCCMLPSKPPDEVVGTATDILLNGYHKYNFVVNNCEDFAAFCKTGLAFSLQAFGTFEKITGSGAGYVAAKGIQALVNAGKK